MHSYPLIPVAMPTFAYSGFFSWKYQPSY